MWSRVHWSSLTSSLKLKSLHHPVPWAKQLINGFQKRITLKLCAPATIYKIMFSIDYSSTCFLPLGSVYLPLNNCSFQVSVCFKHMLFLAFGKVNYIFLIPSLGNCFVAYV